jgi:hypothetical protein
MIDRSRPQKPILFRYHAKDNQAKTNQKRSYNNSPNLGRR